MVTSTPGVTASPVCAWSGIAESVSAPFATGASGISGVIPSKALIVKSPLFTPERRVFLIREAVKEYGLQNVSVDKTDGLITEFCTKIDASIIVKGLRQNSDYEAELGMALINKKLSGIETVFMPAEPGRGYISSSIIKDVARFGGDITGMVPNCVIPAMEEVFGKIDSGENRL